MFFLVFLYNLYSTAMFVRKQSVRRGPVMTSFASRYNYLLCKEACHHSVLDRFLTNIGQEKKAAWLPKRLK